MTTTMDCHLFAYPVGESPLNTSIYSYTLWISIHIHQLVFFSLFSSLFPNLQICIFLTIFSQSSTNLFGEFFSRWCHLKICPYLVYFSTLSGWEKLLVWVCPVLLSFVKPVSPNDLSLPQFSQLRALVILALPNANSYHSQVCTLLLYYYH